LEFRHSHFFEEDTAEDTYRQSYVGCYGIFEKCKGGNAIKKKLLSKQCDSSGLKGCKIYMSNTSDEVNKKWAEMVKNDECLKNIYVGASAAAPPFMQPHGFEVFTECSPGGAEAPPFIDPHCNEKYNEFRHESGTIKGQYQDYLGRARDQIRATLKSTNLNKHYAAGLSEHAAAGLFILNYDAFSFENVGDNVAWTAKFNTRIYSPSGNGKSIDLHWYRHYREGVPMDPEYKYSILYAVRRQLEDVQPFDPTITFAWRKLDEANALAILEGNIHQEKFSTRTFATLPMLREWRTDFFGDDDSVTQNISLRKVFAILARASGANLAFGGGGWLFRGMRVRYELYHGEDSDEEVDGNEDGSGCVITYNS